HVPPGATQVLLVDYPGIAGWTRWGYAVVGNVRLAARDLLARPAPPERPMPAPRPPRARVEPPAAGERMSVAFALQTLADVRDAHDIVVEEAPSARPVMQEHLPFTHSGTFYTMDSGGLGYGMPAAVGVALAQ
ncbi:benzoylformate decarboxylase, partial [Burkholderia contaminans]